MLRIILGLVCGVVIAMCLISGLEFIGSQVFPFPAGVDPYDRKALEAAVAQMPLAAELFLVVGWAVGAAIGGAAANLVARRRWPAWVVGALVALGSVANSFMIPQPLWLDIAGVAAPLLAAWLVSRVTGLPRPPVAA